MQKKKEITVDTIITKKIIIKTGKYKTKYVKENSVTQFVFRKQSINVRQFCFEQSKSISEHQHA